MSANALVFMIVCVGGYLVSFALCIGKVIRGKDR